MTQDICYSLICTIYTTFQKACPSRQSAVFQNLFDRLKAIPDEHAKGIRERLEELDSLPQNLGKAILGAWETFKLEHGVRQERGYCPTCQNQGGWITLREDEKNPGRWINAFAPCPMCSQSILPGTRLLGRKELEDRGAKVVPPNYPGGWRKWMADQGMIEPFSEGYLERLPDEILSACRNIADKTGYDRGFGYTPPTPVPAPAPAFLTDYEDSPF